MERKHKAANTESSSKRQELLAAMVEEVSFTSRLVYKHFEFNSCMHVRPYYLQLILSFREKIVSASTNSWTSSL